MRTLTLILITIFYSIISAQGITIKDSITISGMVIDNVTGTSIPNVQIEISRIGDDIITRDTINTMPNSYYEFIYPFELVKYKKKYNWISIKPLNNDTYWFKSRQFVYSINSINSWNIEGLSYSSIDTTSVNIDTISVYVKSDNNPIPNINLLLTQISANYLDTLKDSIITDSNGCYEIYTQLKEYEFFSLIPISEKWTGMYNHNSYAAYWRGKYNYDQISFNLTPIGKNSIAISGYLSIPTVLKFSDDKGNVYINTDFKSGYFIHYVDSGWSGTIAPHDYDLHTWTPGSITLTNVQESQTINFKGEKVMHTISGHVYINEGDSVEFVYIKFGGDYYTAVTDSNGFFSIEFQHYHSLEEIIPIKKGYSFNPSETYVMSVNTDKIIDFIAIPNEKVSITGTINDNSRSGIDSVQIIFSGTGNGSTMTDINGFFSHLLRIDWSGTITPIKKNMVFNPPILTLNNIDTNMIVTTVGIDTIVTEIIDGQPVKLNKKLKIEFKIVVYNIAGKLIGTAKNIEAAKMLTNKANGFYLYQRIIKNSTIKTKSIMLVK